jgi:NAD(P)-dependent dehydrogenase (short-subunit alcohol dehydrogenase family)
VTLFDLDGNVAVVTGALGRLGPVWCGALLEAGARVLALDLASAGVPAAFENLQAKHGSALRLRRADVSDRAALVEVQRQGSTELGPATILVNNAGIDQPPGPTRSYLVEDIPLEVFRRIIEVNLLGAFQVAQVFGRPMLELGRGSIINIGSLYASVAPDPRFYDHIPGDPPFVKPPAYGASKSALVNLTRFLATHWASRGVRVNALSPGGVLGEQDEEFKQKFTARVPLGRMAVPADLAGPLVFLASPAAAYITGIELRVDGGYTAW